MSDTATALAVLRRAAENERQGYHFYQEAVDRTVDARGKAMFESLGKDETRHLRLLLVEYESLEKGEGWVDPEEAMGRDVTVDLSMPLFQRTELASMAFPWSEADEQGQDELYVIAASRLAMLMQMPLDRSETRPQDEQRAD